MEKLLHGNLNHYEKQYSPCSLLCRFVKDYIEMEKLPKIPNFFCEIKIFSCFEFEIP
jgi:hypothetical protein